MALLQILLLQTTLIQPLPPCFCVLLFQLPSSPFGFVLSLLIRSISFTYLPNGDGGISGVFIFTFLFTCKPKLSIHAVLKNLQVKKYISGQAIQLYIT